MKNYKFHIERKVTVWMREYHEFKADSLEEAKKQMIELFRKNIWYDTILDVETVYDTEQELKPSQNDGLATAELYCDEDLPLPIATNTDKL